MTALYNFVDAVTGDQIGKLNQLALPVCPRSGDIVTFAGDDQSGEVAYTVVHLKHVIRQALGGEVTQIVNVLIWPVEARH